MNSTIISNTSDNTTWASNLGGFDLNAIKYDVSTAGHLRKSYPVDGMTGIITTDNRYTDTNTGAFMWKSQKGAFATFGEQNVYGTENEKFYMHLSFGGVGSNLHTGPATMAGFNMGNFHPTNGTSNYGGNPHWGLQNIRNYNQQTGSFEVTPWYAHGTSSSPPTAASTLSGSPDPSGPNARWENQWNPTFNKPENEEIIKNLVAGGKFQFSDDPDATIYTILKVTEKRLYNYIAWNRTRIWDGSNMVIDNPTTPTGESIWAYYNKWKNEPAGGSKFVALELMLNKIVEFGSSFNRRVCYILELDKDPRVSSYNPQDLAFKTPTFMKFMKSYISDNSTVLSIILSFLSIFYTINWVFFNVFFYVLTIIFFHSHYLHPPCDNNRIITYITTSSIVDWLCIMSFIPKYFTSYRMFLFF